MFRLRYVWKRSVSSVKIIKTVLKARFLLLLTFWYFSCATFFPGNIQCLRVSHTCQFSLKWFSYLRCRKIVKFRRTHLICKHPLKTLMRNVTGEVSKWALIYVILFVHLFCRNWPTLNWDIGMVLSVDVCADHKHNYHHNPVVIFNHT